MCLDCGSWGLGEGDWFGHGALQAFVYDEDGRLVRMDLETLGTEEMPVAA